MKSETEILLLASLFYDFNLVAAKMLRKLKVILKGRRKRCKLQF